MALVVKSAVRELLKGKANVSEEFLKALDASVASMVNKAVSRAKANGRKTVKARDA
jgi:histone H3/H4